MDVIKEMIAKEKKKPGARRGVTIKAIIASALFVIGSYAIVQTLISMEVGTPGMAWYTYQ